MNFLSELKRRNVFKVALAYALLGWLAIEMVAIFVWAVSMPNELSNFFACLVALGFPIALVISWKFEMTPMGMKRTQELSPNESIPYWSRRKFAGLIIASGLIATALTIHQWVRR